jgi:ABC-type dipeptide/oligopeptide/nickel transport system ATPase component
MTPLLDVQNLSIDFKLNHQVIPIIKNISFTLNAGETLGIVGESGSGKTVTVQSILRLIPQPPLHRISGKILFQQRDLLQMSKTELRKIRGQRIAYIFQEPMTALNPVLTIGEQIREMLHEHRAIKGAELKDKIIDLLYEVGIPSPEIRINSYPHELSGGMRQRAMIAMALSCDPEILLADEPTTALDVTIQAQVLDLFQQIASERGMAIIFVTHDLSVIAEIANQVLVMKSGKQMDYGDIFNVFDHPTSAYTKQLLAFI